MTQAGVDVVGVFVAHFSNALGNALPRVVDVPAGKN